MATDASASRSRVRTLALVAGVALGAGALISGTWELSHDRIVANEHARLLASLTSVVDASIAGEPAALELHVTEPDDHVMQIYAMVAATQVVAWVYVATAPQGYNGPIELLVGVRPDATVSGVRVLRHREAPGLGDAIETGKSDWIRQFADKSLAAPTTWALRADGGSFDAITGATVTPRAVVAAIESVLRYHRTHEAELAIALQTLEMTTDE